MLVHAHEIFNKLLRVLCKISQVEAHRLAFIEIFEVESLVRWRTELGVAVSGSLEVVFGDLNLVPKSS